jgi:hypothetical protein
MAGIEQKSLMVLLLFSCGWMAGVGWYVQLVHYPAFLDIEQGKWQSFHRKHSSMTGVVVIGPMILQGIGTGLMFLVGEWPSWFLAAMVVCFAFSFGWTFFVSGPLHTKLSQQDKKVIRKLIRTNWPRAIAWSGQALLAAFWLVSA